MTWEEKREREGREEKEKDGKARADKNGRAASGAKYNTATAMQVGVCGTCHKSDGPSLS
jgi:cytochrome c553